jgi:hypothetical protein
MVVPRRGCHSTAIVVLVVLLNVYQGQHFKLFAKLQEGRFQHMNFQVLSFVVMCVEAIWTLRLNIRTLLHYFEAFNL